MNQQKRPAKSERPLTLSQEVALARILLVNAPPPPLKPVPMVRKT